MKDYNNSEIPIYQSDNGMTKIDVTFTDDYVEHLDNVLKVTGEKVLEGAGSISHEQAMEKANEEYQKYQIQNLSPV